MSTSPFVIETDPTPEQIQYLEDRLYEFNSGATDIRDGQGLAIFVRDEQDRIVAGICGHTRVGCCEIQQLWVEASWRRQGLGTRLLQAAEQEARRRRCPQIILATFDFQAPEFYTERGFHLLAVVDDYLYGHQSLLLERELGNCGGAS